MARSYQDLLQKIAGPMLGLRLTGAQEGPLLNFDPVSTHEKCCNRPKIVAIAEIATLFFCWEVLQALAWVKLWTTLF
jgi:hypothetical protein